MLNKAAKSIKELNLLHFSKMEVFENELLLLADDAQTTSLNIIEEAIKVCDALRAYCSVELDDNIIKIKNNSLK